MTRIFPSQGGRGGTLIFSHIFLGGGGGGIKILILNFKIFGGFQKDIFRVKRFCGYFLGVIAKTDFFCRGGGGVITVNFRVFS